MLLSCNIVLVNVGMCHLCSVLWKCWLFVRRSIWPIKNWVYVA